MPSAACKCEREINSAVSKYWHTKAIGKPYGMPRCVGKPNTACGMQQRLPSGGAAEDECRLVEGFTARYNLLVEIPGVAIFLAERRNMVLRCFQDGFLGHVHKYLGFLVTDPVDMLR